MTQRNESASPAHARMTTAEATVRALIVHDIDTIYALPGVHNDSLFDALFRAGDRVRTIHTRHEQGAAYMALGAALATAKPQAYAVVPGPGLLNSAAALLTAYGMNAPVLALIGQIPQSAIGRGLGHLHEIRDQRGIIDRLVDFCARIRDPNEAAGLVAQAVQAMRTGRPGPAVLECAMDVWGRSAPAAAVVQPLPASQPAMDEDAIRDAAKRLAAAKRPLIVAGGVCSTAAIRSASRCRSAANCGARPMWCSPSALACSTASRSGASTRASPSFASTPIPRSPNDSRHPLQPSSAMQVRSWAALSTRFPAMAVRHAA